MPLKCKMFADEQQNALYEAMHKAAGCTDLVNDQGHIYEFLEDTPRGTIVCQTIDALNELGYEIIKSKG